MRAAALSAACFLTLLLLSPGQFGSANSSDDSGLRWVTASDGAHAIKTAAYLPDTLHSERNTIGSFFEWTNTEYSHSSMGSFLLLDTNSVRQ